jgi:hypothetical protein
VGLKAVQFLALVLTALALVPGGAHFFELANKIGLGQEHYFVVQSIYRGWALFGIVLFGALAANFALVWMLRGEGVPFRFALTAVLCIAATLAIFFTWTYPANVATGNWTAVPANWQELRRRWEFSHAANFIITFVGFASLTLAVLTRRSDPPLPRAPDWSQ